MIALKTRHGRVYRIVATATDVVRQQSAGMGSDADVRAVAEALARDGACRIDSTHCFRVGTAAGRPVATYRAELTRTPTREEPVTATDRA